VREAIPQARPSPPAATVGYREPEGLDMVAQTIESRYGAWGDPSPEEMVSQAKADGLFAGSEISTEQLTEKLSSWRDVRNRRRQLDKTRTKAATA
jgi:hypothetical protein